MTVTNFRTVGEGLGLLRLCLVPRELTTMLLDFAERDGVLGAVSSLRGFTFDSFVTALSRELGYKTEDPVRSRMTGLLFDFLAECGVAAGTGDPKAGTRCIDALALEKVRRAAALDEGERTFAAHTFSGQMEFFSECLERTGAFLRGADASIGFSEESIPLWDKFLGNYEFTTMRSVLLRFMRIPGGARVLDLCAGLGHGVVDILNESAGARVTALDRATSFIGPARERVERFGGADGAADVEWHMGDWRGFGDPLPFGDASFDAVHFSCSDPYIPEHLREGFYRDVHRVLKPGGVLGLLTWTYPDTVARAVENPWLRRQILVHDFAESVCAGWRGFSRAAETGDLFRRIGFNEDELLSSIDTTLSSSLWILRKDG